MNPSNGPGKSIDPNYVTAVKTVDSAGTGFLVFGYVYTRYGKRPLSSVEADVNKYKSWYNVDGIFVDQTASSGSPIPKVNRLLRPLRGLSPPRQRYAD
jgi:hypothetical protein